MAIPLHFASLYDSQGVFVCSVLMDLHLPFDCTITRPVTITVTITIASPPKYTDRQRQRGSQVSKHAGRQNQTDGKANIQADRLKDGQVNKDTDKQLGKRCHWQTVLGRETGK